MALKWSTEIRDFCNAFGSLKQALEGGIMEIYTGTTPTDANSAATGTKLVSITLNGASHTPETTAAGIITLTGNSGSITSITVNSVEILGTTIAYTTDVTTTAALAVAAINARITAPRYRASSSAGVITIKPINGIGAGCNTYALEVTSTITHTHDATVSTTTTGVSAVNGLTWGLSSSGTLSGSGIWSGTVIGAGTQTAGYFRILGPLAASGAATDICIQGTCGTSGADYIMTSTSLTYGATHTIDTKQITFPAA